MRKTRRMKSSSCDQVLTYKKNVEKEQKEYFTAQANASQIRLLSYSTLQHAIQKRLERLIKIATVLPFKKYSCVLLFPKGSLRRPQTRIQCCGKMRK